MSMVRDEMDYYSEKQHNIYISHIVSNIDVKDVKYYREIWNELEKLILIDEDLKNDSIQTPAATINSITCLIKELMMGGGSMKDIADFIVEILNKNTKKDKK